MADEKAEAEGGSKKKLIIIIAIGVLALLLAGGAAFFFLAGAEKEEEVKDPGDDVPVPQVVAPTMGPLVNINEFVVNIISEDENHYIKTSLTLELSSQPASDEVNMRMPQMRDAIILILGDKDYRELQDMQGKKQLKAEIQSKINSILSTGKVTAIFFTDFVVQ
ncbi:MAG: flagellar basal body-associated FliL family protein [Desulfotalea sp.]